LLADGNLWWQGSRMNRSSPLPLADRRQVFTGPGYRVYFCRRSGQIIVLLCSGDKSTQQQDIQRAIQMAAEQ